MLQRLYQRFGASRIEFSFHPTDRNGPLQEFFRVFDVVSARKTLAMIGRVKAHRCWFGAECAQRVKAASLRGIIEL